MDLHTPKDSISTLAKILVPVQLYGDNQGSVSMSKNPIFYNRSKHIEIKYRYITQLVDEGFCKISYVLTEMMFVDGFTKALLSITHLRHMRHINLTLQGKTVTTLPNAKYATCSCGNIFKDLVAFEKHIEKHNHNLVNRLVIIVIIMNIIFCSNTSPEWRLKTSHKVAKDPNDTCHHSGKTNSKVAAQDTLP